MKCPNCGADSSVVKTVSKDDEVVRRRRCKSVECLKSWKTSERRVLVT